MILRKKWEMEKWDSWGILSGQGREGAAGVQDKKRSTVGGSEAVPGFVAKPNQERR